MTENQPRVLVIDDDNGLQDLIKVLLEGIGIMPLQALTAAEGARILREEPLPALVLLDLMLPDVSGMELLRQIRMKPVFDELPIVILSALVDPDQIRRALNGGADRYITKPYIASNLTKVVQDVIAKGRAPEVS